MGGIKLRVHPLFFPFGLYYAFTGRVLVFVIYTVSAVLHELGHSFVASSLGYKLKKITLMPFGALVSGEAEGLKAVDQLKIALAGPLLNFGVGLFFIACWWIFPELYAYTDLAVEANLSLAVINFLPVFPLDGGRVLYSALCGKLKKTTAKRVCKGLGVFVALALVALFVVSCFYNVNPSLLFFSLFVLVGALDRDKENAYVKVYSTLSPERLKRGVEYKKQGVDKSITVKKLVTLLDADAINEVVIYDGDKPIALLSQEKINKILENCDLYSPVSNYLAI